MNSLYITDNGLQLQKRSNRIAVKKEGKIIKEIPTLELKRILIFGNNQLSTDLMRHLSAKGVEVAFLSSNNRFKFRLVPETSKNIYLRMAQHDQYRNMSFRISWGRSIIETKLKNQRNFLIRCQKNQPDIAIKSAVERLKECMVKVGQQQSIEQIMGVEGYGSARYFEAFAKIIRDKSFVFTKRQYHPPPDPVNAMLSFGYMMLLNELNSLLEAFGFDVFLGFLHSAKYGRASLATDLIEEFRSPIIDRLVIYLINLGVIKPSQFVQDEKDGVKMDDKAIKSFLANYEKFMSASFVDYQTRQRTNFRQVIREKVLNTEQILLNRNPYKPYIFYP
jgi:CRISPR-associated protein Cas1